MSRLSGPAFCVDLIAPGPADFGGHPSLLWRGLQLAKEEVKVGQVRN